MRTKDGKILVVESKVRTIPAYDTYTRAYMHQVGKQYAIQKEMRKEEVLSFRKNEKYYFGWLAFKGYVSVLCV